MPHVHATLLRARHVSTMRARNRMAWTRDVRGMASRRGRVAHRAAPALLIVARTHEETAETHGNKTFRVTRRTLPPRGARRRWQHGRRNESAGGKVSARTFVARLRDGRAVACAGLRDALVQRFRVNVLGRSALRRASARRRRRERRGASSRRAARPGNGRVRGALRARRERQLRHVVFLRGQRVLPDEDAVLLPDHDAVLRDRGRGQRGVRGRAVCGLCPVVCRALRRRNVLREREPHVMLRRLRLRGGVLVRRRQVRERRCGVRQRPLRAGRVERDVLRRLPVPERSDLRG